MAERPVGDPLAVGEAGAVDDARSGPDPGYELGREPRLARPRLGEHCHKAAAPLGYRGIERSLEESEFFVAPDHRRSRPPRRSSGGRNLEQPVRGHRPPLPFQFELLDRLDRDCFPDKPIGLLADQDLPGSGGLLEPSRHVDRVPKHDRIAARERITTSLGARDHLAGVHPDPHRDQDAEPALQIEVEPPDPLLDLESRAASPQRIVLVSLGYPEHPHNRVADELLHTATVALERRARLIEIRAHQTVDSLRVDPLG
jgi:hypothetical protein